MNLSRATFVTALAATALAASAPKPARACGGCFVPPSESTVVTDHRMAFSLSKQQTVLWDQIRYSGDPANFAWVLPVREGTKIELSNEEWFAALDASTQPTVVAPNRFGGGAGCALTGCAADNASSTASEGSGSSVTVLNQAIVGPYETATLRSTDPDALTKWLRANDYTIPVPIEPTIRAYVNERFDFLAMRLRPDCGVRAMQPVRIVSPGADPTLPLRMVAAGVGANVGLTLYVISEGRYRAAAPFAEVEIDDSQLLWDRVKNSSNYQALSEAALKQNDGRSWIVEYSDKPQINPFATSRSGSAAASSQSFFGASRTPGLYDAYIELCRDPNFFSSRSGFSSVSSSSSSSSGQVNTPCERPIAKADSGAPKQDAGQTQGDGGIGDGEDPGTSSSGGSSGTSSSSSGFGTSSSGGAAPRDCSRLDDLAVATAGMVASDVWLTRMRAFLPSNTLALGDLKLEAHPSQVAISNVHQALYYQDEERPASGSRSSCDAAPKRHEAYGSWTLVGIGALAFSTWLRRRRRP